MNDYATGMTYMEYEDTLIANIEVSGKFHEMMMGLITDYNNVSMVEKKIPEFNFIK